jgi:poly-gamma-glutamate capsule biosynthesis protein CapA/YwtB (metallophosphatase superfamily)
VTPGTTAASSRPATSAPASPSGAGSTEPPSPTASATERGTLVIHGTGDVNLDPDYIPTLRTHGFGYAWSGLGGLFRQDDLTVVNLECPVSDVPGVPYPKDFVFRGDPAGLPAMKEAGVEVANLGNNHSQDYGVDAMLDSRTNLLADDIQPVGAGKDLAEAAAPAVFDIKGWKVAVVGFGGVFPTPSWFAGPDHPGMASGDDIPTMVDAVRAADEVADIVVVIIHWGVELDTEPRQEDVERAHAMIDAGADVIIGGHSHRLNPMGTYKGRPIFWSLGNFVWPSNSYAGSVTAVGEVTVTPDETYTGRLLPAFIEDDGHPVLQGG